MRSDWQFSEVTDRQLAADGLVAGDPENEDEEEEEDDKKSDEEEDLEEEDDGYSESQLAMDPDPPPTSRQCHPFFIPRSLKCRMVPGSKIAESASSCAWACAATLSKT